MLPFAKAVAANQVANAVTRKFEVGDESPDTLKAILQELRKSNELLESIEKSFATLPDLDALLQLRPSPAFVSLSRHGRKHMQLFAVNNSTQLSFDIPGVGTLNYTLAQGWNTLDLPEKTLVSSASQINILYRCTDKEL